jgi:hypothetical protein
MSKMRDGGISALAGYLYQIVGVLGMQAAAHCSDASSNSDELNTLLTLTRLGELHHEHFDQDAVIQHLGVESGDEVVLVQFKFSRQISPPPISPKDLLEIANALYKSAERASKQGRSVTGYALVTNRHLGDQAKELLGAAIKGASHSRLKSEKQSSILYQLRTITELHLSDWDKALRHYAHRFGAKEPEVEDGIHKLIGKVLSETAKQSDMSITEADLIEAFTGCRDARPLMPGTIVKRSADTFPINLPMAPIRRQLLDEVAEATAKRALVVLYGMGGCGKTVALWQWARELTSATFPGAGAFTVIRFAGDILPFWVAEMICKWGNLSQNPSRYSEQPEYALERLCLANPDLAHPIIHLGLDGLDEEVGSRAQENIVKEILRWFWEEDERLRQEARPPKATLLLTCRDAHDLEQKWLRLDSSGFGYKGILPYSLKVSDFSWEELLEAAKEAANQNDLPELYQRIRAAIRAADNEQQGALVEGYELSPFGASDPFMIAADEEIFEALKHPAMWRSLLELKSDIQLQALDGEAQATQKLVDVFVNRFCRKVVDRGRFSGLREPEFICILNEIVGHCLRNGRIQQLRSDWVDPACNTKLVGARDANVLYSEALSGGVIIQDDPNHWRWRHNIVRDYLTTVSQPEKGVRHEDDRN